MDSKASSGSRRTFLDTSGGRSGGDWGGVLLCAGPVCRGAFADAAAHGRAVLPRQAAARSRQRSGDRRRLDHAGRRRNHAPHRPRARPERRADQERRRSKSGRSTTTASTLTRATAAIANATRTSRGTARSRPASNGEYRFRTIKPVPYSGRTPHIHLRVNKGTASCSRRRSSSTASRRTGATAC